MKLTFLILIVLLALLMPVLWISGTLTSIIYFFRHRSGTTRGERTVSLDPQLGLTMADGGDPLDEAKKAPAVEQAIGTGQPQGPSGQPAPTPVSGKMFWWGGYY